MKRIRSLISHIRHTFGWFTATRRRKFLSALLSFLVLLTSLRLIFLQPKKAEAYWYNESWSFRKKLVIDHNQVSGSTDLTDFPILISRTDTDLKNYAQSDGDDILFTDIAGTKLSHEIEKYDSTTGELIAWVKIPTLYATAYTTIYMYYGNPSASSQQDTTGTWNSKYKAVWHLKENGSSDPPQDSTNSYDGTATGDYIQATGKIGYAQYFNGGDYINFGNITQINGVQKATISTWIKKDSSLYKIMVGKQNNDGTHSLIIEAWDDGYLYFDVSNGSFAYGYISSNDQNWHHVVLVFDGSQTGNNRLKGYLDGSPASLTYSGTIPSTTTTNTSQFYIGRDGPGFTQIGYTDETRVLSDALTADWIATEYNNQNSPSTFFYSIGQVEIGPSPVLLLKFDDSQGTTAQDSSNYNNDGSVSGATWKTKEFCISESCLYFDGTDDVVTVTNASSIDLNDQLKNQFTITGWFKANSDGEGNTGQIFYKGTDTYARITNESSDGLADLEVSLDLATTPATVSVTNAVTLNKWHHLAIGYTDDSDDEITIYLDGRAVATSTNGSGSPDTDTNNLLIGGTTTTNFHGFIDEFKIYEEERTANQIKSDFIRNPGPSGSSASFGNDLSFISNGLIGYWKMDESSGNYTDLSGNGNTGTKSNGSYSGGKFGNGFATTNANSILDQVVVTDPASGLLDFSQTQNFSYSLWLKMSATETLGQIFPLRKGGVAESFTGYTIKIPKSGSGYIECQLSDGDGSGLDAAGDVSSSQYWDGKWHLITCVVSRTENKLSTYIDGVLVGTDTNLTEGSLVNSYDLTFGEEDSAREFTGGIDEVRIYNRALTPAEVFSLYNWAPGPVAYWKMDENTGSTAYDSSGNGYNATIYNSIFTQGKFGSGLKTINANSIQEYATLSDQNNLDFTNTQDYTVSAWVKMGAIENTTGIIINKGADNISNKGYDVYANTNYNCAYTDGNGSGVDYATSSTSVDPDWHYVSCVMDRSGDATGTAGLHIFIDGVRRGSDTSLTEGDGGTSNTNNFTFGEHHTSYEFSSLLDEVKVYRYARTQAQIIEDMNAGHPAPGSPVGSATAHWKFDEGYGTAANDQSPITNHQLTLSSASWTNSGKFGKAWNGTGSVWLSRSDDSDFDVSATDNYTISLWFKSDSATNPSSTEYLFNKANATTAGYAVYVNTSGQICFGIDDDTSWGPDVASCTSADVYDAAWHHVVAVRDVAADKLYLYVDGSEKDNDSDPTTATLENSLSLYVGDRDGTDNSSEFNGDLDEIKIFRLALTSDRVKVLYNQGSSAVWGALSTDSSNKASWSDTDSYCPPGQTTVCIPPVGEWKLDENTGQYGYDTSTSNNSVTLGSNNTADSYDPTWVIGKTGSALNFDSTDDYAKTTTKTNLDNLSALTITAWIYPRTVGQSNAGKILTKTNTGGSGGWNFDTTTGPALLFKVDYATTDLYQSSASKLVLNEWQFVAVTWNGSATYTNITFYHNGIKVSPFLGENGVGSRANDSTYYVRIGNQSSTTSRAFDGYIDQVRLYDYVRTPAQIAWDYNRGAPQGWWKLDENTGTTAYDSSGNGYDSQTFTGNTTWTTGKFNSALTFDGTNDVVMITERDGVDFGTTTDNYSISAWFKTSTDYTTNPGTIVAKNDGSGVYPFDLHVNTSEQPCVVMNDGTTRALCGTKTVNDGNWHLITAVRDISADTVTLYIDGIEINSTTDPTTATMSNDDNISIGNSGAGTYTTNDFNGQIDDVRIFNYNLTSYQAKLLYNGGSSVIFGPLEGLP